MILKIGDNLLVYHSQRSKLRAKLSWRNAVGSRQTGYRRSADVLCQASHVIPDSVLCYAQDFVCDFRAWTNYARHLSHY